MAYPPTALTFTNIDSNESFDLKKFNDRFSDLKTYAESLKEGVDTKVDKVINYGLSKNDFTDSYKSTLDNLSTNYYNKTEVDSKNKSYLKFTYVVTNNTELSNWASNKSGNDYTSVLIKSGNYSLNQILNLTTTKTKSVIGEDNAIITIGDNDGFYYTNTSPLSADYFIDNIHVISTSGHYCFCHCQNMTNCVITGGGDNGFVNCWGLINCWADVSGYYIFTSCDRIVNCYAKGTERVYNYSSNIINSIGYATGSRTFQNCENLQNCYGEADLYHSYHSCTSMINCSGTSVSSTAYWSNRMYNCNIVATGDNGICECADLIYCRGTAQNSSSSGIINCSGVIYCNASGYTGSYSSSSTTDATYLCANTLNGGWNQ